MNNQRHVAEKLEVEKLNNKIELMSQLGNYSGFFDYYFNVALPKHPTRKAAFEHVNELYEGFFKEPRYAEYRNFRRAYNHYIHKKPTE